MENYFDDFLEWFEKRGRIEKDKSPSFFMKKLNRDLLYLYEEYKDDLFSKDFIYKKELIDSLFDSFGFIGDLLVTLSRNGKNPFDYTDLISLTIEREKILYNNIKERYENI